MGVKLRVYNESEDGGTASEYLFEEDLVTIGRGSGNDLTLPDPDRIVSTEHAEVRLEGNTYKLVDRGSKNFTYLRDQRLEAGEPYALQDGDVFEIGNFQIEFYRTGIRPKAGQDEGQETVFAADFSNPFTEAADMIIDGLEDIIAAYEDQPKQRRNDALEHAVKRAAEGDQFDHEAVTQLIECLGLEIQLGEEQSGRSGSTVRSDSNGEAETSQDGVRPSGGSSAPAVHVDDQVADKVIDTLLESLASVVEIPWQFRHEFIGQTIMQSPETEFIYDGDAAVMKEHLMSPSISEDERSKRLDHVREAADSLAVHQVAMLNGYKASVVNGTEELVGELDPGLHKEEVRDENVVFDYLPMLASPLVVDRVERRIGELRRGDWSAAEQRIFRPAFIKAYLARMTATPSSDKEIADQEVER